MKTFEEIAKDKVGELYLDKTDEGVRFLIMRGPSSLCAYVGLPSDHPLSGFNYDDLPIGAHGGLTFSEEGDGTHRPAGYYWYGWDYSHFGDFVFYNLDQERPSILSGGKPWTVEEVEKDSWYTIWDFKKLRNLAEKIALKKWERKNGP